MTNVIHWFIPTGLHSLLHGNNCTHSKHNKKYNSHDDPTRGTCRKSISGENFILHLAQAIAFRRRLNELCISG